MSKPFKPTPKTEIIVQINEIIEDIEFRLTRQKAPREIRRSKASLQFFKSIKEHLFT